MWQDFDDWMGYVCAEEERIEGRRRADGAHYLPFWRTLYRKGVDPTQAVEINIGTRDFPSA